MGSMPTVTFVFMDSKVKRSLVSVQDWRMQKDVGMSTKRSASDMVVRKYPFLTTPLSVSHPLKTGNLPFIIIPTSHLQMTTNSYSGLNCKTLNRNFKSNTILASPSKSSIKVKYLSLKKQVSLN